MILSDHFFDQCSVTVVEPRLLVARGVWPIIATAIPWVGITKRQSSWAPMSLMWMIGDGTREGGLGHFHPQVVVAVVTEMRRLAVGWVAFFVESLEFVCPEHQRVLRVSRLFVF